MKPFLFILVAGVLFSAFIHNVTDLPTNESTLFSGSGNCTLCHSGSDGVLINSYGRDVSPVYHWQSSMMGNAAFDPYWQAKVTSEVEENLHLKEVIEDKCATCHAPMGRTEAIYTGQNHYSFSEILNDPLSLDGVSCTLCHQIDPANVGNEESFSGNYVIQALKDVYGPYEDPFTRSMVNNTGYTPVHGQHIEQAALCATCHTLSTPYVDENGEIAGYFPEQMPYYEWLNSTYHDEQISCQQCHMPRVNEGLIIASMPPSLSTKRSPVFEHHFVGGNTFVNRMINENHATLGINSAQANLDTTYAYAQNNLKQQSVDLLTEATFADNQVNVQVIVQNKTGHKLPTGFPSRRIWIHFTATNLDGDTIFESGKYNDRGEILQQQSLEIHHDTIAKEDKVQIYEAVLGNTLNEVTTILLEASQYLKDNRIPPTGFQNNQSYDSLIAITGNALSDANFNRSEDGTEGSGADVLTYSFPYSGDQLKYSVELCYQSIKPRYVAHLAESKTEQSTRFTEMFNASAASKVEIMTKVEKQVSFTPFKDQKAQEWKVYPNPSNNRVVLEGVSNWPVSYSIYSLKGELVASQHLTDPEISLETLPKGLYLLRIKSGKAEKSFKIVYI